MQHPSTSIACRRRKQNLEKQRRTGSKRPWKPRRLCRAPVGKIWGCINTCGTTFVGLNIHLPAILDCFGIHQDTIVFNTHLFNFIYCFGILVRDPHPMRQLEHQACFEFDKAGAKGRWAQRSCVFRCRAWRLGWVSDQSCDGRTGNPPSFADFHRFSYLFVGWCWLPYQAKSHFSWSPWFWDFSGSTKVSWFPCFPHPDAVTGALQRSYTWWFLRAAD